MHILLVANALASSFYHWNMWQEPLFNQNLSDPNQNLIYATSATGSISTNSSTVVQLFVTGEIGPRSDWIQRPLENSGWNNSPAYTSSTVQNLPANGDQIGTYGGFLPNFSLTFSEGVLNPVLNIYSLGAPSITGTYRFDQAFSVLSYDSSSFTISQEQVNGINVYSLSGNEWNGAILFSGTYTNLTWTVTEPEYFSAWAVGVESIVPEPSTYALLILAGTSALLFAHRKRR
jgi:hypothetical protein